MLCCVAHVYEACIVSMSTDILLPSLFVQPSSGNLLISDYSELLTTTEPQEEEGRDEVIAL